MAKRRKIFNVSQLPDGLSGGETLVDNFVRVVDVTGVNFTQPLEPQIVSYFNNSYHVIDDDDSKLNFVLTQSVTSSIQCGVSASYSGGIAYPSERDIYLGPSTGVVTLTYNAQSVPDRYIIKYNGSVVLDTGYRGSTSYDYLGASRASFTNSLLGKIDPITGGVYPFAHASHAADNYPVIAGAGSGTAQFTKSDDSSLARVLVYAPISGTAWSFTLGCPDGVTPTPKVKRFVFELINLGKGTYGLGYTQINEGNLLKIENGEDYITSQDLEDGLNFELSDYVLKSTLITINGVTQSLYANRTWTIGASGSLDELSDVVLTAPSNGQVLLYNGTNWVNAAPPGGGGGTVIQVDTGTGLTGGPITTSGTISLTGQSLSFHTLATDGILYKSGATIGARVITAGTGISIADGNGASGNPTISIGTINLDDISDVVLSAPSSGQILQYNGTNWVNGAVPGGGGGTVTSVTAGTGLSGGVITTTGTLAVIYGTTAGTSAQGNDSRFHDPITIGTANGLSLSSQILSLSLATTGASGAMSSTDKSKLDSIAAGADNYGSWSISTSSFPTPTTVLSGKVVNFTGGSNIGLSRTYDGTTHNITINGPVYSAGSGLTLTNNTFAHNNTAPNISPGTYGGQGISTIQIDSFGHVMSIGVNTYATASGLITSASFSTSTLTLERANGVLGSLTANIPQWNQNTTGNSATSNLAYDVASGDVANYNTAWTLPGTSIENGFRVYRASSGATNKPVTLDNANWLINIYSHPIGSTASYGHQIAAGNTPNLYFRQVTDGSFGDWLRIARYEATGYLLADNWIRVGAETGLYCTTGHYFYNFNGAYNGWIIRSSSASHSALIFQTEPSTTLGAVYADSTDMGFTYSGLNGWRFRVNNSGNGTFSGTVSTSAPAGSSAPGWKLGGVNSNTGDAASNFQVVVEIAGTVYKLLAIV